MMRLTARDTVDSGLNAVIENSLEARQYSQFFTIDTDTDEVQRAGCNIIILKAVGREIPS